MSPGGRFAYTVQGAVCRLYDREELPWPSCSLVFKGKQPSWNRVGARFIADMAAANCPSYSVHGVDSSGDQWDAIFTFYWERLTPEMRKFWVTKKPQSAAFPVMPHAADRLLVHFPIGAN